MGPLREGGKAEVSAASDCDSNPTGQSSKVDHDRGNEDALPAARAHHGVDLRPLLGLQRELLEADNRSTGLLPRIPLEGCERGAMARLDLDSIALAHAG
eukprot:3517140-Pyramimonas_sp.AAC.1